MSGIRPRRVQPGLRLMDTPLPPPSTVPVPKSELLTRINVSLADNEVQAISPEDVRSRLQEMVNSLATIGEVAAGGEMVLASVFGASPTADRATNTAAIQAAIDFCEAQGGGIVQLGVGTYNLGRSTLNEIYDPGYTPGGPAIMMPRSDNAALILRSHVTLQGMGRNATTLDVSADYTDPDPYKPAFINCIVAQRPDGSGAKHLGCKGRGSTAGGSAGIFQSQPDLDPAKQYCRNYTVDDVYVRDFGGYGVGIEHGSYDGVTLRNIYTYNTGADGIDTKDGNGNVGAPLVHYEVINCRMENCHPRKWGMRGASVSAAAIDIDGPWDVNGVYAINESNVLCAGLRVDGTVDPVSFGGRRAKISNFHIEDRGTYPDFVGLSVLSYECTITNGIVEGGKVGCAITGTNDAAADRCLVSNVICMHQSQYGFQFGASAKHVSVIGCSAVDSEVAGFKSTSGANVSIIGCHAYACALPVDFPVGTTTLDTAQFIGNSFGIPGEAYSQVGGPLQVIGNSGAGDGAINTPITLRVYDLATTETTWDSSEISSGIEFYSADASGVGAGRRAVFGAVNSASGGSTDLQIRIVPTATGTETVGQAWYREGGSSIGHGSVNPGFGSLSVEGFYQLKAIAAPPVFGASQYGRIYIDEADGDLKIIFANGVVKTLATN